MPAPESRIFCVQSLYMLAAQMLALAEQEARKWRTCRSQLGR